MPYLCLGFDDFIFSSAPRYYSDADTSEQTRTDHFTAEGVQMVTTSSPGEPVSITAAFGPVFRRLIDAMPAAVRALVDGGNAVIFDDVLHDREMYESRRRAFAGLDVFAVGVVCALEVLEARERERGDRVLGRARGLVDVVHGFCSYDVRSTQERAMSMRASRRSSRRLPHAPRCRPARTPVSLRIRSGHPQIPGHQGVRSG